MCHFLCVCVCVCTLSNGTSYVVLYSGPQPKRQKLYEDYPTPSNASEMTSTQHSNIKDHRGKGESKEEAHGIHVSLMWKGFAEFICQLKNPTSDMPQIYLQHANELSQFMSFRGWSEKNLQQQLPAKLRFLGEFKSERLEGGSRTDLTLTTRNGKKSVNIKLKAELGNRCSLSELLILCAHLSR